MNDYFEQEEKMEKAEAEREASRETAKDIKATAESEVKAVREHGAKIPKQIEESAARAGAGSSEVAPIVAEARAKEAKIEKEAEAAKADLNKEAEDIEIVEKESLEDEIRRKYKDAPLREVNARMDNLELLVGREKNPDARELLEAELDILAKVKKEKMPAKVENKEIEVKLPAWDETEEAKGVKPLSAEGLPPVEEFETVAKEHEERAVPSPEKVKPVEVLSEEVIEPAEEEMARAKVKPMPLEKRKPKEEPEEISIDFGFRVGDKVPVVNESGKVEPGWTLVSFGKDKKTASAGKKGKDGEPMLKTIDLEELKQWKRDEEFFRKGEKESRKRTWRGVKSLTKVRGEYAAQRKNKVEKAFKIAEPEIKKKHKPKRIKLKVA